VPAGPPAPCSTPTAASASGNAAPACRHLSALPLFPVAGLANLCYVLFTGGHLHLLGSFDPAVFVGELASRRIQLTQLVPTLIHAVTQEVSSRAEPPDLSDLTEIVYGASPIRPDLLERAVTVLGCRFRQNYASTETGPLPISSLAPQDHDPARGRLATAGRPSLGWEVRLGDQGEIQVRGAAPLPGYWRDPDATSRAVTADGFQVPGRHHRRPGAAAQRDRQGAARRAARAVPGRPGPARLVTAACAGAPAAGIRTRGSPRSASWRVPGS